MSANHPARAAVWQAQRDALESKIVQLRESLAKYEERVLVQQKEIVLLRAVQRAAEAVSVARFSPDRAVLLGAIYELERSLHEATVGTMLDAWNNHTPAERAP